MSSLAESLRPTRLDEIIGQTTIKRVVKSWIEKDNFPRCQLYTGPVGTGKSSLAEIVAKACQGPSGWEGADIRQINAGTVGKVADARALASESSSVPFIGRYRVFILEEAHRMTDEAQDAILVPMEVNPSTAWILTSSKPSDLLPGIRSRCAAATFEFRPLNKQELLELSERALLEANPPGDWHIDTASEWLYQHDIRQPREILGILEQHFTGLPLEQCVHDVIHEPLYKDVAGAVLSGNWTKAAAALAQIKTADARGLIGITSAFFRSELVKCPVGPRADALAICLVGMDQTGFADGPAYGAVTGLLYKCAKAMGAK